ncbi:hypothetical protein PSE10B_06570 [Pseudomonas amygdali pv. eriobotryae]|nr:hypothetical protein PSE10B_06570 [Pseudomonas amygdali pv. eriobotryae]
MFAPAAETFPLTAAQRDIWLDQISRGDSPLYNIGGYLQLTRRICIERWNNWLPLTKACAQC